MSVHNFAISFTQHVAKDNLYLNGVVNYFSRNIAEKLDSHLDVYWYKYPVNITGTYFNSVVTLKGTGTISDKTRDRVRESVDDLLKVHPDMLNTTVHLLFNSFGELVGHRLDGEEFVTSHMLDDCIDSLDDVISHVMMKCNMSEVDYNSYQYYSVCGKLFSFKYTFPTQAIVLFLISKLSELTFVDDSIISIEDDPSVIGTDFVVSFLFDTYFSKPTSLDIARVAGGISSVVASCIGCGLFSNFVVPDLEFIEKMLTYDKRILRISHDDSIDVEYDVFMANKESYVNKARFINLTPVDGIKWGIDVEVKFLKSIVFDTIDRLLTVELQLWSPAPATLELMKERLLMMFNNQHPYLRDVEIF